MHVYMEYECAGKATQQDTHIGGRPRLSAGWLAGYAHRGREGGGLRRYFFLPSLPSVVVSAPIVQLLLPRLPPPISCLWATFAAAVVAALLAEIEREEDAGAGVGGGRERR